MQQSTIIGPGITTILHGATKIIYEDQESMLATFWDKVIATIRQITATKEGPKRKYKMEDVQRKQHLKWGQCGGNTSLSQHWAFSFAKQGQNWNEKYLNLQSIIETDRLIHGFKAFYGQKWSPLYFNRT